MRKLIVVAAMIAAPSAAFAQYYGTGSNPSSHAVQGYTTQSGTYVAPHYATNPNSSRSDNYGSSGNYNPYTGSTGRSRY